MAPSSQNKRYSPALVSEDETERFYSKLREAVEDYKGFGPLPQRTNRNTYRRIFHLAYAKHYINPEENVGPEESENWLLTYDERERWLCSFPEEYCPPGLQTFEALYKRIEKAKARINKQADLLSAEYGDFEVITRSGAIYVRHVGDVVREDMPGVFLPAIEE